jgi:excisionase family DNA binding protein
MSDNYTTRLTRLEVCSILRISLSTLESRISTGEIKVIRDGKRVFILKNELDRYLSENNANA